jgi:ribonuclease HI
MPFRCETCGASFDVPAQTLAKYPGWKPRYCREHSPKKKAGARRRGGGGARRRFEQREENLTLEQVLARYTDGPQTGVFTDGSAVPNPGPGGWGVVWVVDGEVREQRHGRDARTTNNRMELTALIEAFKLLPEDGEATVYTDSRLCVDTITKWAPGWERRGWKRKGGEIQNLELVQELLALFRAREACALEWIAAHSGNRWNEYADSLATAWMRSEL